ncbi:formylmethanofuran dehydrogenase [Desulfopila sp. IMCC35006]|uniref:FmdE family protein n=1 Tax=Desulfopila sp. IMCC35006 TaxID=2569542 RepID=UPI0010ADA484|nr:FmdE family protein [Desulfopila sp. IMCC35006]TKB24686.1 formylmethanofuran dehydrogenase [Desulfopila sp. IMCC35006]
MYIPESIQANEDYQACITFHGHTCMGVTIGYQAAKLAMKLLGEMRAVDEELIVIVENDACCCDAIQVLTGCTFGKGNFFYRDHGKMAFTFGSRTSGQGVRLLLKPTIFQIPEREKVLAEKIGAHQATVAEKQEYQQIYEARGEEFFSGGPEAFFDVEHIEDMNLPPKAPRVPSLACYVCGEMVMQTKLTEVEGHLVCRGCLA